MLNGAIIGFGAVAQNAHTPAFKKRKKQFNITAVADVSENCLKEAKKLFPAAGLYKTADELLSKEKNLHFIDIATPPLYHYKTALKVFEKNLHILCEKPLVLKMPEFKNLAKISKSKKLCLFTVHNWKYAPPILKAKELIDKGIPGKINHIELHVLRSQPSVTADKKDWRSNPKFSGGGIFTDHGWHNLYLAYHLAGNKKPLSITTKLGYSSKHNSAENHAQALINFQDITSYINLTWKSTVRDNCIFIYGSKANMQVLDDTIVLKHKNRADKIYKTKEKLSAGSAHPSWMEIMLDDFTLEIENQKKRGANLTEAGICLNLLQAGYKSAKTNKTVNF